MPADMKCPDCGQDVYGVVDGQICDNCGYIFREELPCLRWRETGPGVAKGHVKWVCVNDHTGCLYNDGHNGCGHEGDSVTPLKDKL